jgi:hypothetical protein
MKYGRKSRFNVIMRKPWDKPRARSLFFCQYHGRKGKGIGKILTGKKRYNLSQKFDPKGSNNKTVVRYFWKKTGLNMICELGMKKLSVWCVPGTVVMKGDAFVFSRLWEYLKDKICF